MGRRGLLGLAALSACFSESSDSGTGATATLGATSTGLDGASTTTSSPSTGTDDADGSSSAGDTTGAPSGCVDPQAPMLCGDGIAAAGELCLEAALPYDIGAADQLSLGDIDGNGTLDFLVRRTTGEIDSYWGMGDGAFEFSYTVETMNGGRHELGAINGDTSLDVVLLGADTPELRTRLGDGTGGFTPSDVVTLPGVGIDVEIGDINGDNLGDLVVTTGTTIVLIFGNATGFDPGVPLEMDAAGVGPVGLALVRLDGEPANLAAAFLDTINVGMYRNIGAGLEYLGVTPLAGVRPGPLPMARGDVDGDGREDVVVGVTASAEVHVLLASEQGELLADPLPIAGPVAWVGLGDVTGDCVVDLVVAGPDPAVVVHAGDGHGGFAAPRATPITGAPNDLAVADFDGDGVADVLYTDDAGFGVVRSNP